MRHKRPALSAAECGGNNKMGLWLYQVWWHRPAVNIASTSRCRCGVNTEQAIHRELCNEAIRLATLLAGHPAGKTPETFALMALMHLHAARMTARQNGSGGLLLLEEQDRELWDPQGIQVGLEWLAKSAQGERFSRYHADAGIAAEHCLALSFPETRWDKVVGCYELLERVGPSAIHKLNRAVAVAEWQGPAAGLVVLEGFEPPTWLAGSYLWAAVLADLHRRCGNADAARRYRNVACKSAPTAAVKELLQRRLIAQSGPGKNARVSRGDPRAKDCGGSIAQYCLELTEGSCFVVWFSGLLRLSFPQSLAAPQLPSIVITVRLTYRGSLTRDLLLVQPRGINYPTGYMPIPYRSDTKAGVDGIALPIHEG